MIPGYAIPRRLICCVCSLLILDEEEYAAIQVQDETGKWKLEFLHADCHEKEKCN